MTSSVVSRVSINTTPSEVFRYLTDPEYHFLWNPHLRSMSPRVLLKEGSSYKTSSLLLGIQVTSLNHVTKLAANRELQIENTTGTLKYRVNYSLQPDKKTTLLICTTELSTDGKAFVYTQPILKMLARRELQSDLKALKLAVEKKLAKPAL